MRALGICAVVIVGLLALFFGVSDYYATGVWWLVREIAQWAIPLLAVVIVGLAAAYVTDDGSPWAIPLWLITAAGVVALVGWFIGFNYIQDRHYAQSVAATAEPAPDLAVRPPFTVSQAQVRSNLGDVTGDVQTTKYVPSGTEFSTLVERRGWLTGYETLLEQKATQTGRLNPSKCAFDPAADARLGGWFSHSLERKVNQQQRWVTFDYDDAYGYCDDRGAPQIVMPLVEQDGLFVVVEKPAGVAVYDGRTGQVRIETTEQGLAEIPGPTYPQHLAAMQRGSTGATGSYWDYVFGRVGWELPDEIDAINSSNSSEFTLSLAADPDAERYVTPMTGRGSATALSAVSEIDAQQRPGGELNRVAMHRLDPVWGSPTAITDLIRSTFGDVFAVNGGADIAELVPTGPDTWVATIGRPQNLLYRVSGVGDLSQPPCLLALDGRQIRCGSTGNPGVATAPGAPAGGGTVAPAPASSDLSTLTPQQLADLARRANDELLRRVPAGGS